MNRAAYFRFNVMSDIESGDFEKAMSVTDIEIKHELIKHTEMVSADLPFVVIRAQLARQVDEDELLELADDLESRFTLDGEALTAELEEPSLTYIEA